MKKLILLILAIVIVKMVIAQEYKSVVQDGKTQEQLAYVNIGIVGKGVGTVSNIHGEYTIKLDEKYDNDTLKFSIIGYEPRIFKVKDYKKIASSISSIFLYKKSMNLKEVVIKPKKIKTIVAGHKYNNPKMILGLQTEKGGGAEVAAYIDIKKRPAIVERLNINIAENPYDSLGLRVNIYNAKDGIPAENILKKPLYVTTKIKTGLLTIDLTKQDIVVNGDFYVGIEWLGDADKKNLLFCAGLAGGKVLVRSTSYAPWEKTPIPLGVGINCVVSYEK